MYSLRRNVFDGENATHEMYLYYIKCYICIQDVERNIEIYQGSNAPGHRICTLCRKQFCENHASSEDPRLCRGKHDSCWKFDPVSNIRIAVIPTKARLDEIKRGWKEKRLRNLPEPPIFPITWDRADPGVFMLSLLPIEIILRIIEFLDPQARFFFAQTCKKMRGIIPSLELEDIIFILHHKKREIRESGGPGIGVTKRELVGEGCIFDGHYQVKEYCYCADMFRHRGVYGDVRAFERACEEGDLLVIKYMLKWRHFDLSLGRDYRGATTGQTLGTEIGPSIHCDGPFIVLAKQFYQHDVVLYLLEECGVDPWAQDYCGRDIAYWDTHRMLRDVDIGGFDLQNLARQMMLFSDTDTDSDW